jgi:uncharacterized membrane protein
MDILDISLIFSIITCCLVTGFIFTYAIVVMPGLSKLNDKEFLKAFQVTDAIIQNNQPLFMLTWVGSIISIISTIVISIVILGISDAWYVVLVGIVYLLGVQVVTFSIHIPLNNHLQQFDFDTLDDQNLNKERLKFEKKWNYFNNFRTMIAFFVTLALIIILKIH